MVPLPESLVGPRFWNLCTIANAHAVATASKAVVKQETGAFSPLKTTRVYKETHKRRQVDGGRQAYNRT